MNIDYESIYFKKALFTKSHECVKDIFFRCIRSNNLELLVVAGLSTPHLIEIIPISEIFTLSKNIIDFHVDDQDDYSSALKYLHENFSDLNQFKDSYGNNLLYQVVIRGKIKLVKLLLEECNYFIDNQSVGEGLTALHHAVIYKQIEIVKLLCKKGANQEITSDMGLTPFVMSIAYSNNEIIKIFLEYQDLKLLPIIHLKDPEKRFTKKLTIKEFKKLFSKGIMELTQPEPLTTKKLPEIEKISDNLVMNVWEIFYTEDEEKIKEIALSTATSLFEFPDYLHNINYQKTVLIIIDNLILYRALPSEKIEEIYDKIKQFITELPIDFVCINNNIANYYLYDLQYEKVVEYSSRVLEKASYAEYKILRVTYINLYKAYCNLNQTEKAQENLMHLQSLLDIDDFGLITSLLEFQLSKESIEKAWLFFEETVERIYLDQFMAYETLQVYKGLISFIFDNYPDLASKILEKADKLASDINIHDNQLVLFRKLLQNSYESENNVINLVDDLTAIEVSNYLSEEEADNTSSCSLNTEITTVVEQETITNYDNDFNEPLESEEESHEESPNNVFDQKLIHQYFMSRKQPLKKIFKFELLPSWYVDGRVIKSKDDDVEKVQYYGKYIYLTIKKELLKKLGKSQQQSFTLALKKGFSTKHQKCNGIKIIEKKLIELKINSDIRLTTSSIFVNEEQEQLIIFEDIKNHQEIKRILPKIKQVKIIKCSSNQQFTGDDVLIDGHLVKFDKVFMGEKGIVLFKNLLALSCNLTFKNIAIKNNKHNQHDGKRNIILLPEVNHDTDHKNHIVKIINQILSGEISSDTIIALERKEKGENLGMNDVRQLGAILLHNEQNTEKLIEIPLKLLDFNIYYDALLFNVAKSFGIEVVGVEGKNLAATINHHNYNQLREEYMAAQINKYNIGKNVIFLVGASHVKNLNKLLLINSEQQDVQFVNIAKNYISYCIAQFLQPMFQYIIDIANNKNQVSLVQYYVMAYNNFDSGKLFYQSTVNQLIKTISSYSGLNFINSIILGKIIADVDFEELANLNFSQYTNPQYIKEIYQYLGNNLLAASINMYIFYDKNNLNMPEQVLSYLMPTLVELSGNLAYQFFFCSYHT